MTFPDTGPQRDGTRTVEQWLNAMGEDVTLIRLQLAEANSAQERAAKVRHIALARKEARRLAHDIERFASEVYGISADEIDAAGPL